MIKRKSVEKTDNKTRYEANSLLILVYSTTTANTVKNSQSFQIKFFKKNLFAVDCTTDKTLRIRWGQTDRAAIFFALRAAPHFLLALALKTRGRDTFLNPPLALGRCLLEGGGHSTDRHTDAAEQVRTYDCRLLLLMEWTDLFHHRDRSPSSPVGPVCAFERALFAFVRQAAAVEATLLPLSFPAWVVWKGTAATGLTVSPGLDGGGGGKLKEKMWSRFLSECASHDWIWCYCVDAYVHGFTHFSHAEQCFHSRPSWRHTGEERWSCSISLKWSKQNIMRLSCGVIPWMGRHCT